MKENIGSDHRDVMHLLKHRADVLNKQVSTFGYPSVFAWYGTPAEEHSIDDS